MGLQEVIILSLAGVAGGIVNALAGGATLLTFPALMLAGLPPITANASNAIAIAPGHLLAALADRDSLRMAGRRLRGAALVAAIGGGLGAALLLMIPERLFELPIPGLIGLATALFALAPAIRTATLRTGRPLLLKEGGHWAILLPAAVYGGFFGAGLGILLTAVLSLSPDGHDLRAVKAWKNALASAVSLPAMGLFVLSGSVAWPETLVMLSGAMTGGFLGGRLITILPQALVRTVVLAGGAVLTVVYAMKYWF
ncbi:MAG: sulfite exporter TauE/SafE family protein [Telmatospirillum sp.]|nr:sulfite exporter TauE/SafE family protein [Telmatospirillum sp.]